MTKGATERDLEWNTQRLGDVNVRKGRRIGNDRVRNESLPTWTVGLRTRLSAAVEDFQHGCPIAGDIPVPEGLEAGNQTGVYSIYVYVFYVQSERVRIRRTYQTSYHLINFNRSVCYGVTANKFSDPSIVF